MTITFSPYYRRNGNHKIMYNLSSISACYWQTPPNKACTGRWGFCVIYKHFSGFEFFLLPSRVHAHPSASNANRWAASASPEKDDREEVHREAANIEYLVRLRPAGREAQRRMGRLLVHGVSP